MKECIFQHPQLAFRPARIVMELDVALTFCGVPYTYTNADLDTLLRRANYRGGRKSRSARRKLNRLPVLE